MTTAPLSCTGSCTSGGNANNRSVRIYDHYAVIEEPDPKYYRHPIHGFSFTALDGKEKWTAYKFTKKVYDTWMPAHFRRICSAIDAFPSDVNFDVSQQSELQFTIGAGGRKLQHCRRSKYYSE